MAETNAHAHYPGLFAEEVGLVHAARRWIAYGPSPAHDAELAHAVRAYERWRKLKPLGSRKKT